jgi:hypothetical protein
MSKAMVNALNQVNEGRRGFLATLLVGSTAAAVLPLMTSSLMAQDGDEGKGKDGKKGKKGGKGKDGKGKGDAPAN